MHANPHFPRSDQPLQRLIRTFLLLISDQSPLQTSVSEVSLPYKI